MCCVNVWSLYNRARGTIRYLIWQHTIQSEWGWCCTTNSFISDRSSQMQLDMGYSFSVRGLSNNLWCFDVRFPFGTVLSQVWIALRETTVTVAFFFLNLIWLQLFNYKYCSVTDLLKSNLRRKKNTPAAPLRNSDTLWCTSASLDQSRDLKLQRRKSPPCSQSCRLSSLKSRHSVSWPPKLPLELRHR